MREIKFRGYDVENETMYYSNNAFHFNSPLRECDIKNAPFEINELMQFTGLKDKKGNDIYEGDILDNEYNAKGIVSFINGMFVVKFTYTETLLTKDNQTAFFRLYSVNMVTKIIGNIHENPELLAVPTAVL